MPKFFVNDLLVVGTIRTIMIIMAFLKDLFGELNFKQVGRDDYIPTYRVDTHIGIHPCGWQIADMCKRAYPRRFSLIADYFNKKHGMKIEVLMPAGVKLIKSQGKWHLSWYTGRDLLEFFSEMTQELHK